MLGLLRISEAVSIAIHICASLAENTRQYHSTRQVSEKLGFSAHHSAKVVQQLVRAGVLESGRGPAGGARLARTPKDITVLEIGTAVNGDPRPKGCLLKPAVCKGNCCVLGKFMAKENERLIEQFGVMTLESVVNSLKRNRADKKTKEGNHET